MMMVDVPLVDTTYLDAGTKEQLSSVRLALPNGI